MKALLAVTALLLSAPAMAGTWITSGTAKLPEEIQVTNNDQVTTYSTAGITSPDFSIHRDSNFGMGAQTRCDPYIGATVEEIAIPLKIKNRYEQGNYNSEKREFERVSEGRTGSATLVIPKGTSVFGRCQSKTTTLEAISIQSDKEFRIEY